MCPSMFPIPLDTVSKMKNSLRISLYVPGSIHHQRQRSHHRNQSRLAASQWSLPQNAEFVHLRWCSSVETRGFGRHKSVEYDAQLRSFCRVIQPPSMPVRIRRDSLYLIFVFSVPLRTTVHSSQWRMRTSPLDFSGLQSSPAGS